MRYRNCDKSAILQLELIGDYRGILIEFRKANNVADAA